MPKNWCPSLTKTGPRHAQLSCDGVGSQGAIFTKARGVSRPVVPHLVHPLRHHLLEISMFFNKNIAEIALLAQQNGL